MCVYIYIRELEKLAAIDAKAAIVKLELAVVYYRLGEFARCYIYIYIYIYIYMISFLRSSGLLPARRVRAQFAHVSLFVFS
jgi:hypothetical protein